MIYLTSHNSLSWKGSDSYTFFKERSCWKIQLLTLLDLMGVWFKVKITIDPVIFAAMSKRRGGSWRIIYSLKERDRELLFIK